MARLVYLLALVCGAVSQFTYLTQQDFINAMTVPIGGRTKRNFVNDMRLSNRQQRAVIARAIAGYNAKTCIRFVPKTNADKDYIVIAKLDGCYADFAHVGGRQQVSLADECIDYATIIHELMHVIGFIHEHQREDRDGFVSIVWSNVIPGANTDFDKLSNLGLSYYGEKYDYLSIMHYESNEGSKNGRTTIEAKDKRYTPIMGRSLDFSASDLRRVNRAYNCWAHMGNNNNNNNQFNSFNRG